MTEPVTLFSATELRSILVERYPFCYIVLQDASYNVPSDNAIAGYMKELADVLVENYGDKWAEYFDCDNFALEAICLAYRKHFLARRLGRGSGEGVAIGLINFRPTPNQGHCIAFYVTADGQVVEFEPQNRQPLPLTPEQCATVSFVFVS